MVYFLGQFNALLRNLVVTLDRNISSLAQSRNIVMETHYKCRNSTYGNTGNISRLPVPDDRVNWDNEWSDYDPPTYTADLLKGKSWADRPIGDPDFHPAWNSLDEVSNVDRKSFNGQYKIVDGYPLNVVGRTGLRGRGILGKWGPNHAADPIVTRWKRDSTNTVLTNSQTNKPILQFVCIKRRDNNEWAFPGGMVDPGEVVSQTLRREFLEETMNSLEMSANTKARTEDSLKEFFSLGNLVYQGYVDDPRNTDNAWMETVAMNFHDETGSFVGSFRLRAGDDAVGVTWMDVSNELKLYASHGSMLKAVAEKMSAHW